MAGSFTKDPDSKLDYGVDWTAWLGSDTLLSSTWLVTTPAGAAAGTHLSIAAAPIPSIDGKITRVWLEGGVVGVTYDVRNRVETTAGRREDRTLKIACRVK